MVWASCVQCCHTFLKCLSLDMNGTYPYGYAVISSLLKVIPYIVFCKGFSALDHSGDKSVTRYSIRTLHSWSKKLQDVLQEREGETILMDSEVFWAVSNHFLSPSWSISVWLSYLGLSWAISDYPRQYQAITGYLGQFWPNTDYLKLWYPAVFGCPGVFRAISDLLRLSLAITGYIWLYLAISSYMWLYLVISGYLYPVSIIRGQVIAIWNFFFVYM